MPALSISCSTLFRRSGAGNGERMTRVSSRRRSTSIAFARGQRLGAKRPRISDRKNVDHCSELSLICKFFSLVEDRCKRVPVDHAISLVVYVFYFVDEDPLGKDASQSSVGALDRDPVGSSICTPLQV